MATYIKPSAPVGLNNNANYASFPAMTESHAGDLVVVYRGGVTAHGLTDGGSVYKQVSSDAGATWGSETLIQSADSGRDLRDVGIAKLSTSGRLLLTYTDVLVSSGHSSSNRIRTVRSLDDGATWETPVDIDYSAQGDDRAIVTCSPIQLSSGRVLLAVRVRDSTETFDNSEIYFSDDGGASWGHLSRAGDGDEAGRMLAEPSLADMPSGDILCLMRDGGAEETWFATSSDSGATWTTPAKAFDSSGAPRCWVYDGKVHVFGRSVPSKTRGWVFWANDGSFSVGEWAGPWEFDETANSVIVNYGDFADSGGDLYAVWAEGQGANDDSDLYFSRAASTIVNDTVVVADSFDRANSTDIGVADGGATGVTASGAHWKEEGTGQAEIQTNKLVNTATTSGENSEIPFITGLTDFDVSVKITPTNSFASFRFRMDLVDTDGYQIQLRGVDGQTRFSRLDAGSATDLEVDETGITGGTEHTLRVKAEGDTFDVYLDGSLIFTVTDATHDGSDHTGIQFIIDNVSGNTGKVDDFALTTVIAAVESALSRKSSTSLSLSLGL